MLNNKKRYYRELVIKPIKENKGITLIALVITIIVLLILAAVSIATLTGENGILSQAGRASEQTEIAENGKSGYICMEGRKTREWRRFNFK